MRRTRLNTEEKMLVRWIVRYLRLLLLRQRVGWRRRRIRRMIGVEGERTVHIRRGIGAHGCAWRCCRLVIGISRIKRISRRMMMLVKGLRMMRMRMKMMIRRIITGMCIRSRTVADIIRCDIIIGIRRWKTSSTTSCSRC